eukprot:GHVU01126912.1.p3 GENE.GHVU01126912.1~~GHVU01126912.1.p3  ORF type:complete len:118 (-),score=18.61 GHVU01126912.1:662-1015(-)
MVCMAFGTKSRSRDRLGCNAAETEPRPKPLSAFSPSNTPHHHFLIHPPPPPPTPPLPATAVQAGYIEGARCEGPADKFVVTEARSKMDRCLNPTPMGKECEAGWDAVGCVTEEEGLR